MSEKGLDNLLRLAKSGNEKAIKDLVEIVKMGNMDYIATEKAENTLVEIFLSEDTHNHLKKLIRSVKTRSVEHAVELKKMKDLIHLAKSGDEKAISDLVSEVKIGLDDIKGGGKIVVAGRHYLVIRDAKAYDALVEILVSKDTPRHLDNLIGSVRGMVSAKLIHLAKSGDEKAIRDLVELVKLRYGHKDGSLLSGLAEIFFSENTSRDTKRLIWSIKDIPDLVKEEKWVEGERGTDSMTGRPEYEEGYYDAYYTTFYEFLVSHYPGKIKELLEKRDH